MKKDIAKYSQISIIVIAVILSVDALSTLYKISYDRIYMPIRNELQSQKNQEAARVNGMKQKCIADAQDVHDKNLRNSCEVKKTGGALSIRLPAYKNLCLQDKARVESIDEFMADKEDIKHGFGSDRDYRYWYTCEEYFFCDSDVISNLESTLENDLKACEEQYPGSK